MKSLRIWRLLWLVITSLMTCITEREENLMQLKDNVDKHRARWILLNSLWWQRGHRNLLWPLGLSCILVQKRPTPRVECRSRCSGGGIWTRDLRVMHTNYDFHRRSIKIVCGLDFLFTLGRTVRDLPSSLYTFPRKGLARDYHATGFPEFDKKSRTSFLSTQPKTPSSYKNNWNLRSPQ